jgi:hypothetical protein
MAVRAARERTFCRTREPAGVLEVLACPGGPEGRWAAEPVMPEPTGQDPDVVGKLQPATVESGVYFLEIYC